MLAVHTILHPTDFSGPSAYALGLACALARDYGARLIALHVTHMPPVFAGEGMVPPAPEEIRTEAEEQLHQLPIPQDDVRVERRLELGDAAGEILRVAADVEASLIVMGTHGRT